mmetsp:Transcript_38349/g.67296  ORF Transcript_38349/g.67296 Transcript_38349/m.67296 type:complete len:94 (+) Transcript_38349:172-453(+)
MSLRASCDLMKGTYPVANKLTTEAANTAGRANCSPARKANINEVASAVLVIATLMPAAKQRHAITGESVGNTKQRARPKAAPAAKNGKIYPPR